MYQKIRCVTMMADMIIMQPYNFKIACIYFTLLTLTLALLCEINIHCGANEVKVKVSGFMWRLYCRLTLKALRYGSHSFTCKLHHTYLYTVSVHQMAPPLIDGAGI